MKKLILLLFIPLVSFSQNYNLTELSVRPSEIDSSIDKFNNPHLIQYDKKENNKLILFLPGTSGKPKKSLFLKTALNLGYRVIFLSVISTPGISTTCINENLFLDENCAEKFRLKRIYGHNISNLITDLPKDAIYTRFKDLLVYLKTNKPKDGWEKYLIQNKINWSNIVVAGQSQGGGMACMIAKNHNVGGVISFSGGWDWSKSPKNKDYANKNAEKIIANWYSNESLTPAHKWYGIFHINEIMAIPLHQTYLNMKIPKENIFMLALEKRKRNNKVRNPFHGEGIGNILYEDVWINILSKLL